MRWWCRSPATSTTPRSCGWCARAFADRLDPAARPRRRRAGRVRRAARQAPARPRVASSPTTPSRPTSCSAVHGLSRHDERRWALGVLSSALGGGMSSRLFQRIREERGLAYSVYSFTSAFADAGQFGVYAGCQPGKADEVLSLMVAELDAVAGGRADRRRDRARQGPDARRHRARPRGRRLAHDPHRQERDRLRRHRRRWTRCWPASTPSPLTDVAERRRRRAEPAALPDRRRARSASTTSTAQCDR